MTDKTICIIKGSEINKSQFIGGLKWGIQITVIMFAWLQCRQYILSFMLLEEKKNKKMDLISVSIVERL